MTRFIYCKVEGGVNIELPELEELTKQLFPDHQIIIDQILRTRGLGNMENWTIKIMPNHYQDMQKGFGQLCRGIQMIILGLATREEMVLSLLHEIVHFRFHDLSEIQIEKMALEWYGKKDSWFLRKELKV